MARHIRAFGLIVYRLGHELLKLGSGVRFPVRSPTRAGTRKIYV